MTQNKNFGFVRVAAAIPELRVADCSFNADKIIELMLQADKESVQMLCFPELCITAYTCADLFFQDTLITDSLNALQTICKQSQNLKLTTIIGMPIRHKNSLYNTAVVIQQGKILGIVPKSHLPNNNEFYEKRWFAPALNLQNTICKIINQETPFGTNILFATDNYNFAIEICEDLWVPIPPSSQHAIHGADIIFNLSASNELIGKNTYLNQLISQQSARCIAGYVYASAGWSESTTDVVYAGNGIIAENGQIIALSERFKFNKQLIISEIDIEKLRNERIKNTNFNLVKSEEKYTKIKLEGNNLAYNHLYRIFDKHPFVPSSFENRRNNCEEIFSIQVGGLAKRWKHTNVNTLLIGVSGGLDSTLALLVCVKTADKLGIDRKKVTGVTMPGFGTTDRTYQNALRLMQTLGVSWREISIKDACLQHFKDINHHSQTHDITYENTQARERTQILMDLSNKENGMVVGTGDLSELALGWATYAGDHISMYAVNSGIPKTLVKFMVEWASEQFDEKVEKTLKDILDTPVSPELLPTDEKGNIAQKTEEIVGPYELHDFFLYYLVRYGFSTQKILFLAKKTFKTEYSEAVVEKWFKIFIKRFFSQQFKRSCMPDGPKVGSINLSPRGDWRMPSDAVEFKL